MSAIFFAAIFLVFYAYFGYPISLFFLRFFRNRVVKKAAISPNVTFIITAFNEGKRIKEKLENSLAFNYPHGKLQIIVASDGSTDDTNHISKDYAASGVELLEILPRQGKENAQRVAVTHAKGEILVFSDVATRLEPDAIGEIVSNFADPMVGCVSSEDRIIGQDGKPCGEGFYVRYEMWLRRLESSVNSLVGLSGSFFAARKEVCQDFSPDLQSDFRTVLNSVKMGIRGVSDPHALGFYLNVADEKKEFDRKVRTVLRGMTVFFRHIELLNIFRYGLFSYQLFCHKLLRWLVPLFLCLALFSNILLADGSWVFSFLLLCQICFYIIAVWGWKITPPSFVFLKILMYFFTVNWAIMVAWIKFFAGKRVVLWTPSER